MVSREPCSTTDGRCGPSTVGDLGRGQPGGPAARARRRPGPGVGCRRRRAASASTEASSALGVLTPAAISQRPSGSSSWVSPTARDSESLVENDSGAPTSVAAALARQVDAASETPTVKTATVRAAVTGRITSVPSRRRRTVREATYDDSARRRADHRTHTLGRPPARAGRTAARPRRPAASAGPGRWRRGPAGGCGSAAMTRAATAAATRASRTITRARLARVGRRTPAIWALSGSLTASRTTSAATSPVTSTTAEHGERAGRARTAPAGPGPAIAAPAPATSR